MLFNHWGGFEFADKALDYAKALKTERENRKEPHISDPIDRLEPNTVMVDFIRYITKDMGRVTGNLYLGKDASDGDNSDNGHYVIDLDKLKLIHTG